MNLILKMFANYSQSLHWILQEGLPVTWYNKYDKENKILINLSHPIHHILRQPANQNLAFLSQYELLYWIIYFIKISEMNVCAQTFMTRGVKMNYSMLSFENSSFQQEKDWQNKYNRNYNRYLNYIRSIHKFW